MKFGKRLLEHMESEWEHQYVPYKTLKQVLKKLHGNESFHAEGEFLTTLLSGIHNVSNFYLAKEDDLCKQLQALCQILASPNTWLLEKLPSNEEFISLASIIAALEPGVHLAQSYKDALIIFTELCTQVDALRKYSILNSLAVAKIIKKHDKLSSLLLREVIMARVSQQPFYMSTRLAATFTHAQCIASDIISAATMVTPDCQDYTCSICLEVLNMPVVLSCTHRFCHSCLSKASSSLCNHSCPLCKKEIDLDPHNYEIDPVLNRFVKVHFKPSRTSTPTKLSPSPVATIDADANESSPPPPNNEKAPKLQISVSLSKSAAQTRQSPVGSSSPSEASGRPVDPTSPPQLPTPTMPPQLPSTLDKPASLKEMFAADHSSALFDPGPDALLRTIADQYDDVGSQAQPLTLHTQLLHLHQLMLRQGELHRQQRPGRGIDEPLDGVNTEGACTPKQGAISRGHASGVETSATAYQPTAQVPRKRACTECHRAKAACEGDPCTRCVRLGRTCITSERQKRRRRGSVAEVPCVTAVATTVVDNVTAAVAANIADNVADTVVELELQNPAAALPAAELATEASPAVESTVPPPSLTRHVLNPKAPPLYEAQMQMGDVFTSPKMHGPLPVAGSTYNLSTDDLLSLLLEA
uniref:RING-type domain-containing protein n=1 Tax=Haptolina ericina TaxID=156174 RepID=A0A7S3BP58_9EUKA|mmetsp:Transcript_64923/g.145044  ORF Transcript_64923/g.145044 Transcript_64923/m.145044 type:complete len:641 (+) Transcript_64923:82-2004(+)|eukprot:CAMPEP_0181241992 /NCGR_PEP_ID=MMETSP1096-20121128/41431_1 /TAXON_ID=156174 ORGANISM="Chrysochromulina ericina, Strain CCMP281" /NCGR_SAMPLE_ID=MMETSP1096 /ASSEMBLY_ACC=CAM_ASM_000453 /LENGTH=640 /DNA_ID=CAMNT_0023338129 /DNA_START=54 /DNA_END=1976 /DNA_ORIENTATION=+